MDVRRILVPVSGGEADRQAIELACLVGRRCHAEVRVVHIIEVARTLPLDANLRIEVQKGESILERVEETVSELDYEVESDLLQAREVGPAIVEEAGERQADLIILGLPLKRRFGEYSLGRTGPYVLKNAPCRVWLCREPGQTELG